MEVRVLGGLSANLAGIGVPLGTPKQQMVFAMLALHPGRLVTVQELVDELWPDQPPRSAVANVRTYAATLRRALREATDREHLVRCTGGYRLQVESGQVDVLLAIEQTRAARGLVERGELRSADDLLSRALGRWRGPMLAGVPLGPVLTARLAAAEEERIAATELLADVHLRLDRPAQAIALLRNVTAAQPLREPARIRLMKALWAQGDAAGALAEYRTTRHLLREELGLAPTAEMQTLHVEILRREDSSLAERTVSRSAIDRLPRPVPDFIGRADVVARHLDRTDPTEARRHRERALAIFRRMGVPERFEVERRLNEPRRAAPLRLSNSYRRGR